jgi:hypothetical protein
LLLLVLLDSAMGNEIFFSATTNFLLLLSILERVVVSRK